MKHINKSTHQIAGNGVIDNLLRECWIDEQACYANADYDNGLCDNRKTSKQDLMGVLLENQNHLCCYCMKHLMADQTTTLEHIIPHNIPSQEDFEEYLICPELTDNVIFRDNFEREIQVIPPQKYPHDIAYHNLVASCDSKIHCNNYRKSKFVRPLFYDSEIEDKIEYDAQGQIGSTEYSEELSKLGLLKNGELIIYRLMWSELARTRASVNDVTEEDIETQVFTMIDNPKFERLLNNFIGTPSKKEELLKYKWFFYYYKNRYYSGI